MKKQWLLGIAFLSMIGSLQAAEVTLGDWQVIGPFKDDAFGNLDRTLAFEFAPE